MNKRLKATVPFYSAVGLIVVAVLLSACPKPQSLTIYNNTQSELVVVMEDKEIKWPPGHSLTIDSDNMNGLYWERDGKIIAALVIRWDKQLLSYELFSNGYPDGYVKDFPPGTSAIYFQMEESKKLYLLRTQSSFPSTALDTQPFGFPLEPIPWKY